MPSGTPSQASRPSLASSRQAWTRPSLTCFGKISALTAAGSGSALEGRNHGQCMFSMNMSQRAC